MAVGSHSIGEWRMGYASYWRCAKRTGPARITTEGNDLKHQSAPHNHGLDVVDTQVKMIQSDMRKRYRDLKRQDKETNQ